MQTAAQHAAQRYRDRLRLLREIDHAILRAQSVDQTADAALLGLRQLVPCLRASVILFDLEADEAVLFATRSDMPPQLRAGARTQLSRALFLGESPQGQPHLVTDLRTAPFAHPWVALLRGEGVRGYASLPLTIEAQVIGALTFSLPCAGPPSAEALEIAADIAGQLAVAIQNARLHEAVRQHAAELEAQIAARTSALRLSEARFRAIFRAAPIGVALAAPDGHILQSNPALQTLLASTEDALLTRRLSELVRGRHERHTVAELLAAASAGQQPQPTPDLALLRADGRTVWARLTLTRVRAPEDIGALALVMIEDVTEARKTQVALVEAEKLALTGRLGASLAHEINNPLQAIIGCLGLADETLPDTAEASRYLAVAREELHRVTRTVAQLRDLQSMPDAERAEPLDLNDLLAQLLTLNTPQCTERGIQIVWRPGRRLPPLLAVIDRMRQVFLNLLLNAMDAMPQGGTLTVRSARTREPLGVRVTVSDTGAGIPAALLDRVFEPFYTTKKQGLGLGLFTSRSIIERHRGAIEVRSRPGRGTTFAVSLPAWQEADHE